MTNSTGCISPILFKGLERCLLAATGGSYHPGTIHLVFLRRTGLSDFVLHCLQRYPLPLPTETIRRPQEGHTGLETFSYSSTVSSTWSFSIFRDLGLSLSSPSTSTLSPGVSQSMACLNYLEGSYAAQTISPYFESMVMKV